MIAFRALRRLSPLATSSGIDSRQLHRVSGVLERRQDDEAASIHPTAVVHPDAVIGKGVVIGPFCTVGSAANIGSGAIVGADLPGRTIIGRNNVIGHHAVVGVRCQDLKYKQEDECFLHVGNNNDIREYVSIHRSSKSSDKTVIGDNNLIMGSCHIAHDCKIGNNNIFANNTLFAGHIVVEDYTHTAGAISVHQFCHIGSHSFIGGGSVITQDVPKYMMVSGERAEIRCLNLEGLRRNGFSSMEVRSMRKAYQKIFMPSHANSRGFEDRLSEVEEDGDFAESPAVRSMVKSIRESFHQSRRGICKFRHWSRA